LINFSIKKTVEKQIDSKMTKSESLVGQDRLCVHFRVLLSARTFAKFSIFTKFKEEPQQPQNAPQNENSYIQFSKFKNKQVHPILNKINSFQLLLAR